MATKKELESQILTLKKEITTLTRDKELLNDLLTNSSKEKRQLEEEKLHILQNNERIIVGNTNLQIIVGEKELRIKELQLFIYNIKNHFWKALLQLFRI